MRALGMGANVIIAEIDLQISALKLASMGVRIDTLTDEQRRHLDSWSMGT
ncbi:hypothetical protein [Candidatus Methylomirabilis sp.]|nr:hypothetical protein [Candidatus Methylomirabilis sp.]